MVLPLFSFTIFVFANSIELGCENSQKSELERSDLLLQVYLKSLSITHFKNLESANPRFSPHLNFITGPNGAGKTNLLDSIYYLCLGKSYFHAGDQQSVTRDQPFFRLSGLFNLDQEDMRVQCLYMSGGKKEMTRNDIICNRLTDHVGELPVVMIAPDDQSIINEGSDERRRFIDNTISQIDHFYLDDLVNYNKVLQHRNAALKRFATLRMFDAALIEALDQQLISLGEQIFRKRVVYFEKMTPLIQFYYQLISDGKENISTGYLSVFKEHDYRSLLKQVMDKDRQLERTTEGIHRDDFEFNLQGHPVKKHGSQGQKKSFLIALKLAQWLLIESEKSRKPLLLLDDLFDKLDQHRSSRILELISGEAFGQVFITNTRADPSVYQHTLLKESPLEIKIDSGILSHEQTDL